MIVVDHVDKLIGHPNFVRLTRAVRGKNSALVNFYVSKLQRENFTEQEIMLALSVIDDRIRERNKEREQS